MAPAHNEVVASGATPVKLPPRAMDVLVMLASHAGEVVTTEALMSAVWNDRVVGDNVLYNAIAQLRRAFDDQQKPHAVIVTVPKRGYRLAAPVERSVGGGERPRAISRRVVAAVMALCLVPAIFGWLAAFPYLVEWSAIRPADELTAPRQRQREQELSATTLRDTESSPAREQFLIARFFLKQQTSQSLVRAAWHFERALDAAPDYVEVLVGLCETYLLQADYGDMSYARAHERCQPLLERVVHLEPASADAFVSRGLLAYGEDQRDDALSAFEEALSLEPNHLNALRWSGVLLRERGEYERALARHARAGTNAPRSRSIQLEVALSLLATGDIYAAQAYFQQASGVPPGAEDDAFESIGYGLLNRDQAAAAVRWAEEHRERLLQYPSALIGMALVRRGLGDAEGARDYLQAAQALNPELSSLYYAWAVVHFNAGQHGAALQAFERRADAAGNAKGFDLHPTIIRGLVGEPHDSLEELRRNYPVLQTLERVPVDHFFILQAYALLQRLAGEATVDASVSRLRELLPDCALCDAMTRAELRALEGDQSEAEAMARQAIADGWMPNHQAVPWNYECNPIFRLLPLDASQRNPKALCRNAVDGSFSGTASSLPGHRTGFLDGDKRPGH